MSRCFRAMVCQFELLIPDKDGMKEDEDHHDGSRNGGWSVHLANLLAWLETGKETKQRKRLQREANGTDQDSEV